MLDVGRRLYQTFYAEYVNLDARKWKLDYWDAGWYQVRNALQAEGLGLDLLDELKEAHKALAEKLRGQVYAYGFLDPETVWADA